MNFRTVRCNGFECENITCQSSVCANKPDISFRENSVEEASSHLKAPFPLTDHFPVNYFAELFSLTQHPQIILSA